MSDELTIDELREYAATALGGTTTFQRRRVLKVVDILIDRHNAALARAEAAEALAYERLEAALFAEQRATDAELAQKEAEARVAELEAEQAWRPVAGSDDELEKMSLIEMRTTGTYQYNESDGYWQDVSKYSFPDDTEWRPTPDEDAPTP